jgi:hypothetical protein
MNIPQALSPQEPQEVEPDMEIMTALAVLPPHALISEHQLAELFRRHVSSVKRAVQREELPPPVALFGANVWTVAVILDHISARLEAARKDTAQTARRLQHLRPGQGGHN